jgi:hypothetical protein
VGAVVGTIALIAIPSLIFGFWPRIRRALQEPTPADGGPGGRVWRREKIAYRDPSARSPRQAFYLWVWLIGCFPVGLLLLAAQRPEGRERSEWVNVCPLCGLREGSGHTSECPSYVPPAEPAPAQPRRCGSCGAAEGEYHDPDRCTDQAALLRQAISLTQQLIQMKEDEIFVKTGRGRDDF